MTEKNGIKEILLGIDAFADSSKYLHQVANRYIELRDLYQKLGRKDDEERAQIIARVLFCQIKDDHAKEMKSNLTNKTKEIIEDELKNCKSIKLRAHYADFLWLSGKDHKSAQIAVDEYLELVKFYEEKDQGNATEHFGLDALNALRRAFVISRQINYEKDKTKDELQRLVTAFNPKSISKNALTINLIRIAIEHKKEFENDFFQKVLEICQKSATQLLKEENFDFARNFWECADKVENEILKITTQEWKGKIAESFVAQADDKEDLAGLLFLADAISAFEQLGDSEKVSELKVRYKKISENVELEKVNGEFDIAKLVQNANEQAEEVLKLEPEVILLYLTINTGIYPKKSQIEKSGRKLNEKFISRSLFGMIGLDQNMNLTSHGGSDNDHFFHDYALHLRTYSIFIDILFEKIIKQDKLNWENLKTFLKNHSWFGGIYGFPLDDGGEIETEKWINLLEPSLKLYLETAKKLYKSKRKKYPTAEIMLATESLSLKIEGILREFFQKLNLPTTLNERIKGGKTILRERDLNSFLTDQKTEEIFGEDLVFFMRAVLTEKSIYNLRNNVAHCFFIRENFILTYLHLLLIIILRIGNYTFNKKKE